MYRLIYKSRSKNKVDWETVEQIMAESTKCNEQHHLTGVLLATDTHFLQVLEGNFEDLNETFFRIAQDSRHEEMKLISYNMVDARLFSAWGMRGIGVFNFNKDIEQDLMEKYGEEDGGVKFPLEEWMALALINDIRMIGKLPDWKS